MVQRPTFAGPANRADEPVGPPSLHQIPRTGWVIRKARLELLRDIGRSDFQRAGIQEQYGNTRSVASTSHHMLGPRTQGDKPSQNSEALQTDPGRLSSHGREVLRRVNI